MKGRIEQVTVFWAVVLVMGLEAGVVNAGPDEGLVGHWELDETSGKIGYDSSGNGHHGTLLGGLSFNRNSVEGVIGRALHLTGAEDMSIRADSVSLPASAFTISMWFNPDSDQDSSDNKWYLMFWEGDEETLGNKPLYEFNEDERGTIRLCIGIVGNEQYKLETRTNFWKAFTWYHLVATFDGIDVKLYVNGTLEDSANQPGKHYASSKVCFGSKYGGDRPFKGKLDDIRIYSRALTADEITGLRVYPALHNTLLSAVAEAEDIIQQKPKEAIVFLEKKITEFEKLREKDPNINLLYAREISFDLYFELAEARKAAGLPEKDVDAARKRAFEEGAPSLSNCGSVLLWLFESGMTEEFEGVVHALIENNRDYLSNVGAEAEKMVLAGKPKPASRFLESNLAAYADWRRKHPNDVVIGKDSLPAIYFQLAKIREGAGMPKKDIADAYRKTFVPLKLNCVSERTAALIWLLENEYSDEYTGAVKSFTQDRDAKGYFTEVVAAVCKNLESRKNWAVFERLLETLFSGAKHPGEWAIFVESCLDGESSEWAKRFSEYVDSKPGLKVDKDRTLAERYAAAEKYMQAARLYQVLVDSGDSKKDKQLFEFKLCKNLFLAGEYREVIPRIESFVRNNKATARSQVIETMLMKFRCHSELSEFDKGADTCFSIMMQWPEIEEMPQVMFCMGYCRMVLGDFEQATDALSVLVQDYPESTYASKARNCLMRIKTITK